MTRLILGLAIAVLTTITSYAQSSASAARTTLDKAAAKINLAKGAYADFTITGAQFGTQKGNIAIKGNKFNARTPSAIIWYDGKTQWLYNKNNEEVNVSTPTSSQQQSMNPYTFLNLYKKGCTLSQSNTANGYQVHIVGKSRGMGEMYITVDKQYNIKQVRRRQGSQWITITISRLTPKSFADSAFRFSAKDYPQAEIIDLR